MWVTWDDVFLGVPKYLQILCSCIPSFTTQKLSSYHMAVSNTVSLNSRDTYGSHLRYLLNNGISHKVSWPRKKYMLKGGFSKKKKKIGK